MSIPSVPSGREPFVQNFSETVPSSVAKPRPRKGKNRKDDRRIREAINMELEKKMRKDRVVLYFDTFISAQNSTTTVGYQNVTLVPQGVTQSARRADTIFITSIDFKLNATTANSDIFATMRWGFFIWKQNSNSVTPGSQSVYENPAVTGTLSFQNYEGRAYYTLLVDRTQNFTGVAAAPTVNSQTIDENKIVLKGHRVDYEQASTAGTGHVYFVNYSDSSLTPHPVYTLNVRVWYFDE